MTLWNGQHQGQVQQAASTIVFLLWRNEAASSR